MRRFVVPNSYTLSTAPTQEPVSVEEAKAHLNVESDDYDGQIREVILSVVDYLQQIEDRQFVTATWIAKLDRFPCGTYDEISLSKSPIASVTSIAYIDADGASQTWDSDGYRVDTNSEPGRITLEEGEVWPTTQLVTNAVTITFTAGQAVGSVPTRIKQHILMLVADLWWNRESASETPIHETMWHKRLLWANRIKQFV